MCILGAVVRKLKEKAVIGVPSVTPTEHKEQGNAHVVVTVLYMLLGLIVPQGMIYGALAPFGISLAAGVSGTGAVLVYIATLVGYLLPGGAALPLRYMAAVAVTGAVRWTCGVLPRLSKRRGFAPLLAFASTLVSGLLMNGTGAWLTVLLTVAESLAAGGFAYFFCAAFGFMTQNGERRAMTMSEQTGVILLGATALMALMPFEWYYLSPGRVLAAVIVMLLARGGREQSGAVAGIVLGVAATLCMPERLYIGIALAFGGLLAGVFSRYGRFAVAGVFLIADVLVCLTATTDMAAAASIYETAAACVVFVVLPRGIDKLLRRYLVYGQHIPAVEGMRHAMTMRLDTASHAMAQVSEQVNAVSQKLTNYGAPDLGTMYRCAGDGVCRNCGLRMYCWEENFAQVMDAFNALTPLLREKGCVEKEELSGFLRQSCRHQPEIAASVNAGYRAYLVREDAWRRLSEVRAVITDQFSGMADMLSELCGRFAAAQKADTETAGRVVALCEDFGMPVEEAVCLLDRRERMTVEILAEDVGVCLDGGKWFRELQICCGRTFDHPTVVRLGSTVKVVVTEKPFFAADIGVAQRTEDGERLSGDVCRHFTDGGQATLIISDGMGSGGRAAVDGALAAGIAEKLLQAGLSPDTALRIVNTALLAKSGDESLTTLDILQVDLFSGSMRSYKAGAAASLLRSGGRVSRVEGASMPVGILRDTGFAENSDTLSVGDVFVMVSDGVLTDGSAWLEEHLRDATADSAAALAEDILQAATARRQDASHTDDMTVAVIKLSRRSAAEKNGSGK